MKLKKYKVPKSAITERGLKRLIREASKKFSSQSEWAQDNKITPQAVSAFMRGTQGAGLQIPEALGYRPQLVFIPIDEELITTMLPPRRPAQRPTKKVDHSKDPIEKRHSKKKDLRKETKKRLKRKSKKNA